MKIAGPYGDRRIGFGIGSPDRHRRVYRLAIRPERPRSVACRLQAARLASRSESLLHDVGKWPVSRFPDACSALMSRAASAGDDGEFNSATMSNSADGPIVSSLAASKQLDAAVTAVPPGPCPVPDNWQTACLSTV